MNLRFSGVCVKYNHELLSSLWGRKAMNPAKQKPYLSFREVGEQSQIKLE